MKGKGCESVGNHSHFVAANFDLTLDLDLGFSWPDFVKALCVNVQRCPDFQGALLCTISFTYSIVIAGIDARHVGASPSEVLLHRRGSSCPGEHCVCIV